MEQFEGVVTELGDAVVKTAQLGSLTTYTYVNLGSVTLKKLKVFSGIDGKLKTALSTGGEVTLFTKNGFLVGIKLANGQTFGSDFGGGLAYYILFTLCLIMGVWTVWFIIGFVFLWVAWEQWRVIAAKRAAASLPNVVLI
jgi:hypothetical protein